MRARTLIASVAGASAIVIASIAGYEGYVGVVEPDPIGIPTGGFGTTSGVKLGERIDPVRAVQRLAADADATARGIGRCIGEVTLRQHEWDAYVSLAYNVGVGAFCRSTLARKLRALDYEGACREILRWNRAGGKVLPGLVKRRAAEFQQCMGGAVQ